MFILITLLCVWLGWEASIVHQRKTIVLEHRGNTAFQFWEANKSPEALPLGIPAPHVASIPIVRAWLGDKPIQRILYTPHHPGFSETELVRLGNVFPEAELSERLFEPCHPGCFPGGTLVNTPRGPRPIDELQVGEFVTTFGSNGGTATARVQSIFVTDNRLWEIRTDQGMLLTTETQPLCVTVGTLRRAGELEPGEAILQYRDGSIVPAVVREVSATDRTGKVFNLILDDADVFVAGGFLARSKPPAPLAAH
jgi:hypothetical protein